MVVHLLCTYKILETMIDPVSLGLGAVGAGMKIFSAIKGAQANKATQRLLDEERAANEAMFGASKQDFLETNAAKSIMEKVRENQLAANKQAENNVAKTGGTAEAEIAAKSAIQEKTNDVVSDIAGQATQYQNQKEAQYLAQKNALNNQQIAVNSAKAENAANLSEGGSQLLNTAATVAGMAKPEMTLSDAQGIAAEGRSNMTNFFSGVFPKSSINTSALIRPTDPLPKTR